MESSEPFPTSRRDANRYRGSIWYDSAKTRVETELSDARRKVQELAQKIEEANSRARGMQQRQQRTMEWREVMKEIEDIKQELGKLKLDMAHVVKEKRQAERAFKASSSKMSTLSTSMAIIKKEIEELDEEQVLVELARIEAVKECDAIEARRKEEANRYQTQLEEVKKKVNEIVQHNELTRELQTTLYDVSLVENELAQAKETEKTPALLKNITEELEAAKIELAAIKREGCNFMTSMDAIRVELKHVREETARLEKQEEKQDLTVQTLNAKMLTGKAKLVAVTAAAEKAMVIASNLSLTVDQLRAEAETAMKEKEIISEELEKIKLEIPKTESEIELAEKRLEAAMEELKAVKSSESTALENLKNLIESTVRARESASLNSSTITITHFEYEYLTQKASGAEEIADKKVAAAQVWVEALKANEKEILMNIEMAQRETRELNMAVDEKGGGMYRTEPPVSRRRSVDGELTRWAQNGAASPRKSLYRNGNMMPVKRARSHKFLSPATRHAIRLASFTKKREKVMQKQAMFLREEDDE